MKRRGVDQEGKEGKGEGREGGMRRRGWRREDVKKGGKE